jgi:hypothetical protein
MLHSTYPSKALDVPNPSSYAVQKQARPILPGSGSRSSTAIQSKACSFRNADSFLDAARKVASSQSSHNRPAQLPNGRVRETQRDETSSSAQERKKRQICGRERVRESFPTGDRRLSSKTSLVHQRTGRIQAIGDEVAHASKKALLQNLNRQSLYQEVAHRVAGVASTGRRPGGNMAVACLHAAARSEKPGFAEYCFREGGLLRMKRVGGSDLATREVSGFEVGQRGRSLMFRNGL